MILISHRFHGLFVVVSANNRSCFRVFQTLSLEAYGPVGCADA